MKYFSTALHIFFTCKILPGKACTNHKLGSYNLFSNCRQNVRIQLCPNVTNTLYMTRVFFFLLIFNIFTSFSYFHYSVQLLPVHSLFDFGCTCVNSEIRSFIHSKSKEKKQSSVPKYFWVWYDWHYYSLDWFIFLILFKN